jgi:hypothetical protein
MEKVLLHDGKDISHLKIYYDSKLDSYRHRFICNERGCKNIATCICYEDIESAILSVKDPYICDRHYLIFIIDEETLEYAYKLQELLPKDIPSYNDLTSLLERISASESFQDDDLLQDELNTLVNQIILHYLSEELVKKLLNEADHDFDCDILGETCPIQ